MVSGTKEQAQTLRDSTAELLAQLGLRLSQEKTLITHVDQGLDFLGFRIQRRPREGKSPCAYTFISKANFEAIKRKESSYPAQHAEPVAP